MYSGNPDPASELSLLLETKRNTPSQTVDIVSDAAGWLKAQLKGAQVPFQYGACAEGSFYGYASFIFLRNAGEHRLVMEAKLAEVAGRPYLFAEVRGLGQGGNAFFPYFGEIHSDEGRQLALHYISDYLLSTEA